MTRVQNRLSSPAELASTNLGECCWSDEIEAIVLPVELTRPSLFDRLRGRTIDRLKASSEVKLVFDDPDMGPRLC